MGRKASHTESLYIIKFLVVEEVEERILRLLKTSISYKFSRGFSNIKIRTPHYRFSVAHLLPRGVLPVKTSFLLSALQFYRLLGLLTLNPCHDNSHLLFAGHLYYECFPLKRLLQFCFFKSLRSR